jgi:hypothetical protein
MLKAGKILLIIAGFLLIFDAFLMALHIPNPFYTLFGWPLPCPLTLLSLGLGILLTAFGSQSCCKK